MAPSEILPGLYLGAAWDVVRVPPGAPDGKWGLVLCAARELTARPACTVSFEHVALDDTPSQTVTVSLLRDLCAVLDDALDRGASVLVHCAAGRSRSPTVVMAYLIWAFGMTFEEAQAHVVARRPVVDINLGFMGSLLRFEAACIRDGGRPDGPRSLT